MDEATVRLGIFLSILALMALWEVAAPRRRQDIPRLLRWSNNLALVVLDALLVRLAFPVTAAVLAGQMADRGWGVLNWVGLDGIIAGIIAFILFDLAIYLQHLVFHRVPALWRLHRMHHADLEFDVTTGLRFHPLEILVSMGIKLALVAVLGPPALAVLIFEIALNGTALFNHSNVKLSLGLDRMIRLVMVTPDMHRVHHSVVARETHSNFGFNLPWWDWLFGTYVAQPAAGHEAMQIGLPEFRTSRDLWLDRMLVQPLRDGDSSDPK